MINKLKIGVWIIQIGFVYFLIYNTLFGWNPHPINEAERLCDDIFKWTMRIGVVFYFMPLLDYYFIWVKGFYKRHSGDDQGV